jgi:hypothetical protein
MENIMPVKYIGRFALAAALTLSLPAFAQPQTDAGAKQDMKAAGHETKNAAKDVGHGVKQGTKKAYHKTKHGVKKVHRKMDPDTHSSNPQ